MSLAKLIHKFPIDSAAPYNHRHLHPFSSSSPPVNVNLVHPSSNCNERSGTDERWLSIYFPRVAPQLFIPPWRAQESSPAIVSCRWRGRDETATQWRFTGFVINDHHVICIDNSPTPSHGPWMGCLPQLLCRTSFISHGGVGNSSKWDALQYTHMLSCSSETNTTTHGSIEVMCK